MNSADLCKKNGWKVGDKLAGDEGYGVTVIRLTAIGNTQILAEQIEHNKCPRPEPFKEGNWTLLHREWKKI